MERIKTILEKIVKIIIMTSTIMGVISAILLFRFHLYHWPIIITFIPTEYILLLCLIGTFLMAVRFKLKIFRWLVLVGAILAGINLVGFKLCQYIFTII